MHRLLELPTAQANLIRAVSDCVRKAETICKHLEWTAEDFGEEEEQTLLTRRVADCKAVKPLLARSTVLQAVSSEQQFQTTVEQLSEALRLHTLQSYRSYKKGETELLNTAQFRQAKTSMTAWWKKVNDRMKPPKSPVGVKLPNET
ncbi:MAG: uncharacterized protein KVP18_001826 [Porospora cf. gigantea A]|nr:MAG: hypothetical protein KVP18_001826 [Porospora cf. gigantea A]